MKVRLSLFVMAVLLIFLLAPVNVRAFNVLSVSSGDELLAALASALDGDIIMLTADIMCPSTLNVWEKSVTFDLNGNDLTVNSASGAGLDVRNGGVTLSGSGQFDISGRAYGVCADNSTVTVTNVTTNGRDSSALKCNGGSVIVRGDVTNTGMSGRGVWADEASTVVVDGDVTVTGFNSLAIDAYYTGTTVTVGGNCSATGASSGGIRSAINAEVTVNGTVTCTGSYIRLNMVPLTAAEGAAGDPPYESYRTYRLSGSSNTVVRVLNHPPAVKDPIPARSIALTGSSVIVVNDLATDLDIFDTLTITEIVSAPDSAVATAVLSDGSVTVSAVAPGNTSVSVAVSDTFPATVTITIPFEVPAPPSVCSIGETGYPEFGVALTAVNDGDVIKLLDSISTGTIGISGKSITFDLNGYTLSAAGPNAVDVGSGGGLTVTGTGIFTVAGTNYGIYVHDGGIFNHNRAGTLILSGTVRCVSATGEGSSVSVHSVTQNAAYGTGVYAASGATVAVTENVVATGNFSVGVNADGGTVTVGGNIAKSGSDGKAAVASAGGRVTVASGVFGSGTYNFGAYATSGGVITVGGPVVGAECAAYADGLGSSVIALKNVIAMGGFGAHAKNGATISVGSDVTGGRAYAADGGQITVGRNIISSGSINSYGARAIGSESSVEVYGNVSASGGLASVGANSESGGNVIIHGSITGASGSMVSIGAWAKSGVITVDGTITSADIYIRTGTTDITAADYTLGASPYENYKVYQNGTSIVRVIIPTVINNVTAVPDALTVAGGTVDVIVSGYSIPAGTIVAAFDESGATIDITGLTTGGVNEQIALLTFPANTETIEKIYTIKVSLDGGTTWNPITAAVTLDPVIIREDNGVGSAPTTPAYRADISGGGNVPVNVNTQTGSAELNLGPLSGDPADGGSTVVNMPTIPGVNGYTVNLPAFSLYSGTGLLTLNTDKGSLMIPGNMFFGANLTGEAGITIGKADTSNLPDDVKEILGDRPVIRITLSVDGKQTEWSNPDAPVRVSIPYTPTAEELLSPESIVVWYIDGAGNVVSIPNVHYDSDAGAVIFEVTHFSNFAVVYNPVSFIDVASDAWYGKAVNYLAARGITMGYDGKFSPEANLTRADFLVLMMRAYGIASDANPTDNFSDAGITYYTGHLAAAKRLGISAGVGNNMFAPDTEINRQEMFTMLYNALKVISRLPQRGSDKTLSDFIDAGLIDLWAIDAMMLFVESGTVNGSNGALTPLSTATRAEMAQLLYNLLR